MPSTHPDISDRLLGYLEGRLAESERRLVEDHVERCLTCAGELASLRGVVDALQQKGRDRPPAPSDRYGCPTPDEIVSYAAQQDDDRDDVGWIPRHLETCAACQHEIDLLRLQRLEIQAESHHAISAELSMRVEERLMARVRQERDAGRPGLLARLLALRPPVLAPVAVGVGLAAAISVWTLVTVYRGPTGGATSGQQRVARQAPPGASGQRQGESRQLEGAAPGRTPAVGLEEPRAVASMPVPAEPETRSVVEPLTPPPPSSPVVVRLEPPVPLSPGLQPVTQGGSGERAAGSPPAELPAVARAEPRASSSSPRPPEAQIRSIERSIESPQGPPGAMTRMEPPTSSAPLSRPEPQTKSPSAIARVERPRAPLRREPPAPEVVIGERVPGPEPSLLPSEGQPPAPSAVARAEIPSPPAMSPPEAPGHGAPSVLPPLTAAKQGEGLKLLILPAASRSALRAAAAAGLRGHFAVVLPPEREFPPDQAIDDTTANRRLGRLFGVPYVVGIEVKKTPAGYLVSLRAADTETGGVVATRQGEAADETALAALTERLARELPLPTKPGP